MTEQQLRNALHLIIKNNPNTIGAFVAKEALKREVIATFFHDLRTLGCISGMVSALNQYPQTHHFFETYYEEIEQLRLKYLKQSTVLLCEVAYDLKTALAWFAFEQIAFELAFTLTIEEGV